MLLKGLLIGSILFNIAVVADMSLGISVSNAQETTSTISGGKKSKNRTKQPKTFKKDDHRYNKQYRDFDYERYGYYNNDGLYFGYFDKRGYFFNNIYFEYNSQYTYEDRLYHRGYFAPYRHHYRRYHYYSDNDWNRIHHYREPDEIVYGHYYEERYRPPRPPRGDRYIREEYIRDYYRDDTPYYRDRDFFHDDFFRDDRYREYGYEYRYRDEYRYRKPIDKGHIVYHRFSDKKNKKKHRHKHKER
jgi:hypothetical protein